VPGNLYTVRAPKAAKGESVGTRRIVVGTG
jgi:hypothetical protein